MKTATNFMIVGGLLLSLLSIGQMEPSNNYGDSQSEEITVPEAEKPARASAYNTEMIKAVQKESQKVDRLYTRTIRKSKRWKRKAVKTLEQSTEIMAFYEDQTTVWKKELSEDHDALTGSTAHIDNEQIEFDSELYGYMMDLADYYALLDKRWNDLLTPSIGASLAETHSNILTLKEEKDALSTLDINEVGGFLAEIDAELKYELATLKFMYKEQVQEAANASEIFRLLEFAHEIYPVFRDNISKTLVAQGKSELDRAIFTRHLASVMLYMDQQYLSSVSVAKVSNLESLKLIQAEEDPDVNRLRADLMENIQKIRSVKQPRKAPPVSYAMK